MPAKCANDLIATLCLRSFSWAFVLLVLIRMRTRFGFVVLTIFIIGSIASLPRVCAEDSLELTTTCGDHYNALVARAKTALASGNRSAAVAALLAAKDQLRRCEDRESTTAIAISFNADPGIAGMRRLPAYQTCAGSSALSISAGSTCCPLCIRSMS